ncbi:hypothetical protein PUN28_001927 [Cardiocondyla obscurior]|uniref:Uncharacterized protein n=1 Tax=Cardiocondyla obscurior TaxID=286306 RepID=A0AAW2GRS9_9HYME
MKEAQTVRCVLCHLADPVVPRPRSARCTVAGAAPSLYLPPFCPSFPLFFLLGVTKFSSGEKQAPFVRRMEKKKRKGTNQVQVHDERLLFFSLFRAREISTDALACRKRHYQNWPMVCSPRQLITSITSSFENQLTVNNFDWQNGKKFYEAIGIMMKTTAYYGNITAAASRVETHGAHHRRHRPAHHHLQSQKSVISTGSLLEKYFGVTLRESRLLLMNVKRETYKLKKKKKKEKKKF